MSLLCATDSHMHTAFSDGVDSVAAMAAAAAAVGLTEIVITDHVRVTTDWLPAYVKEIWDVQKTLDGSLRLLSGIEAKVVDLDGNLDARPEFYDLVDLVVGSFHRIPLGGGTFLRWRDLATNREEGLRCWWSAFRGFLRNPRVDVIGHLGAEFKAAGIVLSDAEEQEIADRIADSGKVVDINLRYRAPQPSLFGRLLKNGVPFVLGSDSHSVDELRRVHQTQSTGLAYLLPDIVSVVWTTPVVVESSRVRH